MVILADYTLVYTFEAIKVTTMHPFRFPIISPIRWISNGIRFLIMPLRAISTRFRTSIAGLRSITRPFSRLDIALPKKRGEAVREWVDSLRPQHTVRKRQRISNRAQFSQIHLIHLANDKRVVLHIGTVIGRKMAEFVLNQPNARAITLQFTLIDPSESLIPIRLTCLPNSTKFTVNEIPATGAVYLSSRDTIAVGGEHYLYELYAMDTSPIATRVDAGWATTNGAVRDRNEDAIGLSQNPKGYLFAIADGVGNGQDGDRISAFAIQYLLAVFDKNIAFDLPWRDIFTTGFQYINSEVRYFAQSALLPTGSTLTALAIKNWEAHIAHVGDSRLYRLRNGAFEQLTLDHVKRVAAELPTRYANESPSPAPLHDVLTRAVGKEDAIQPDFLTVALQPGDRFLLVTDGITKRLHPNEMSSMLAQMRVSLVAKQLVELANERGTDDNASVIAVEVLSEAYIEDSWQAVETDRVFVGNRRRSLRLGKREESVTAAPLVSDGCLFVVVILIVIVVIWVLLGLTLSAVSAEGAEQSVPESTNQATLLAYHCTFDANQQVFHINVAINDENGLPFAPNAYQLSATAAAEPFPAEDVIDSGSVERPPLRMILVLDLTDTVPLENILNAISGDFIPRLKPLDELALITFSDEVSPSTRFYTDKNQLLDDYLVGLTTVGGDNRLYEAVLDAADLFPFDSEMRQVVLVVTDSGRRSNSQTQVEQIVTQASAEGTQVYSIGFYSEDRPDEADLLALATGTGGFSWIYAETPNTPNSIESAVRSYFQDFIRLIDSEISVTINVEDLAASENNILPITLSAEVPALETLTHTVNCPHEVITHSVAFTGSIAETTIRGQADIGVVVSPASVATRVIFRVDGEIVQNSTATIYTLDAAETAPGYHQIEVELWNRSNETLATTSAPLRLFTQLPLSLNIVGGNRRDLSGSVEFEVSANRDFAPSEVQLMIAPVLDLDSAQVLGTVDIASNGRGVFEVEDIDTAVRALFPELEEREQLQVTAFTPNTSMNDPMLANSESLIITLARPVEVSPIIETPAAAVVRFDNLINSLPILGTVFFGAVNILLFRAVRKSRIRRIIGRPDNYDLSPQLMSITVYRGGVPQHYTLTKKTVTIGRSSTNDINLGDDPNISRQHGVIMWRRNRWYYSNRKGSLSARINGRRFHGFIYYRLEPMTELQIGNTTMVFHSNAQQDISDFIKTDL